MMQTALKRLHHLSMRYAGALFELAAGKRLGMLPFGHPGLHESRDLIDLVLFARAEINGLTKILVEAKLVTEERVAEIMEREYEWLAQEKARQLGVGISDEGLVIHGAQRN